MGTEDFCDFLGGVSFPNALDSQTSPMFQFQR